ncbi:hypothetical protein [Aquabacterium sp.]|uniref:hypothetical protein n=1 Tax=Aquabacterium sp. TaxID=1872578 RepID=UPI003D6D72FE
MMGFFQLLDQSLLLRLLLQQRLLDRMALLQFELQLNIALGQFRRHQLQRAFDRTPVGIRVAVGLIDRRQQPTQFMRWRTFGKVAANLALKQLVVIHFTALRTW